MLGEMDIYLKLVAGGRGVPPEVVHELQERYAQIGLGDERWAESPHLTRWTLRQAALLEGRLGKTVYVGMRNWEPFIGKVVEGMKRDGIRRARAICLAP
ncbi:MAG: ferrochelatase [Edaphobacter sp.]|nr:ferrochelatase [Edaphobacter sp.]